MRRRSQQPAEALAQVEQTRADGLARRIGEISADPANPSRGSLPLYRAAYQDASGTAAAHTAQPKAPKSRRGWRR